MTVPFERTITLLSSDSASVENEAAGLTQQPTLKNFLNLRADAFLSNDYYASDVAWMDLNSPLDITIGPYETYNDELFGYKAGCLACLMQSELSRGRNRARPAMRTLRYDGPEGVPSCFDTPIVPDVDASTMRRTPAAAMRSSTRRVPSTCRRIMR